MTEFMNNNQEIQQDSPNTELLYDVVDEMGIITESTRVLGNIRTKGHLAVSGIVEGDIIAKGNVIITGVVKGKITCDNLLLKNCHLATEINASGQVTVEENVSVTGKVVCKNISVNGKINGDIRATEKIGLTKNAIVNGNIVASSIGIEFGAKVDGKIQTIY